ncbi:hypothetical protein [Mucilaginibacter sp. R-33]|uniref:hypothetical protein n=1 Tax=unclassified Mucilaginibacter TaxID=2617802 RepID=UPI003CF1165E
MVDLNSESISRFWDWFKTVSADLLMNPNDAYFVNLLDKHVGELGGFDWEIGPWEENILFFAISPNLNIAQLEFTRKIITMAPDCPGWKFLPSKPPKDWAGTWEMENETGKNVIVDASDWKYILYRFDDGTLDIDINISDFKGNSAIRDIAVDIALTGYLGEETFMNLIQEINIVDRLEEVYADKATSLKNIRKHLERIK